MRDPKELAKDIGGDKSPSQDDQILRVLKRRMWKFISRLQLRQKPRKEGVEMTYWRLHYHLIWATIERQPLLNFEREKVFYRVLYEKAKELDIFIHAAGNVDDHVHIVVSIPPKIAVARVVKNIKGASAYAINHMPESDGQFQWQEGYGALSISEISLETVKAYASKQKEHHKGRTIHSFYERIEE